VALLALDAGRVVSVERLIEGLWGDEAPADAGNALRHHVSRLRKTIGPSLVTQRSGYLLAVQHDEVDALHFARLAGEARAGLRDRPPGAVAVTLRSALALWRGAPLGEFLDHDWARREASRLSELHLAAVEDRFDVDLSMGLHADVVEEIRGMVGAHPFRERLWGQLMLALYRSGRQTEALAAYADARKVLAEELGLDPGPDLAALERAILAHDPDLAAPPTQVLDTPRLPAADMPAPLTSFIGRHEQLAAIRSLLNESRLITLTGPPGVGKTRLILDNCEHLVARVAALVEPLLAGCPELHVLATSREALGVPGEAQWPVPSLTLAESLAVDANFARELYFITLVGSPAARSLIALSTLARSRGDQGDADRLLLEGLERAEREADAEAVALALEGLAAAGEAERAATLLGAADSVRDAAKAHRDPFEAEETAQTRAAASLALGPETLERLIAKGRGLAPREAVAVTRQA
jgi:DNA-binding SARP family transcriptional activator